MLERVSIDSDGRCFAKMLNGCAVRSEMSDGCGTYACPFYKAWGCKDWVRLEREEKIFMLTPEEAWTEGGEMTCSKISM